jgi:hypothetical protein
MLRGERIDDLDSGLETVAGYRSTLHGRPPTLQGYSTRNDELVGLARPSSAGSTREWPRPRSASRRDPEQPRMRRSPC